MSKILITSALPYVNGVPHLGHMVGCLLPSDVYARFNRMLGNEVLYICGTDEHGTPSEVGAAKEGMDIGEYCTKYHNRHKEAYDAFNLSFDYFGRTSSLQNEEITYHIFEQLDKNGYIEEKSIKQIFSVDDSRFLPDRYVTGTCPHCGYDKARGDQCENCTKVLEPTELINPRSTISGSTNLEVRETKHLFLKLPLLEKRLAEWVKTKEPFWPDVAYSIAQKWLKEGLQERCITRDLKWGFSVPKPGFEGKVFYVWFDAPIGYIGITKQWADEKPAERDWKSWWLFASVVNKDLNGVLGNFVSRVLKMTASKIGEQIPAGGEMTDIEKDLIGVLQNRVNDYLKYMNDLEFRKALNELRAVWVEGNNYISTTEPWTVIKTDAERAAAILRTCINLIRIFAVLSAPIMPATSAAMLNKLGLTSADVPSLKDFDVSKEITAVYGRRYAV